MLDPGPRLVSRRGALKLDSGRTTDCTPTDSMSDEEVAEELEDVRRGRRKCGGGVGVRVWTGRQDRPDITGSPKRVVCGVSRMAPDPHDVRGVGGGHAGLE